MSIYAFEQGLVGTWNGQKFSVGQVIFSPDTPIPEVPEIVSRDGAPDHGSGPFFRVRGKLRYLRDDGVYWDRLSHVTLYDGSKRGEFGVSLDTPYLIKVYRFNYVDDVLQVGSLLTLRTIQYGVGGNRFSGTYQNYRWNGSDFVPEGKLYTWTHKGRVYTIEQYVPDYGTYSDLLEEFMYVTEAGYIPPAMAQKYASAYMAAASSMPQANVNLMANLCEAFDNIKSCIAALKDPMSALKGIAETATNPKELWLTYRYVYNTNQADAKELTELVSRLDSLAASVHTKFSLVGQASQGDKTRFVSLRFPVSSMLPSDLIEAIQMFGLRVTPSNIWDMIPYSFMVDWFAGIGDKLSFLEDWVGAVELKPENIWFMTRAVRDGCSIYYRVPGSKPVVPPLYTEHSASGKVVLMRVADTISIFS